jgi:hypothetical protein
MELQTSMRKAISHRKNFRSSSDSMKKLCFLTVGLSILIATSGCKPKKEIELTRDNFAEFCKVKLTKVYIYTHVSNPEKSGSLPFYGYEYYINDPKKVEVIKLCIRQANQTEYDKDRFKKNKQTRKNKNMEILTFETPKVIYTMRIGWNDEYVYGFWWESADLLNVFKKWDLFAELSKADPSWPAPDWKKNPPKEMESNFPSVTRFHQ